MIGTTQGYMIYKYQFFALIKCLKNGKLNLVILHLPLEWHQLPNRCKQQTSNPKFRKRSQDMMEFVCFEKVEKSNVGKKVVGIFASTDLRQGSLNLPISTGILMVMIWERNCSLKVRFHPIWSYHLSSSGFAPRPSHSTCPPCVLPQVSIDCLVCSHQQGLRFTKGLRCSNLHVRMMNRFDIKP